MGKSKSPRPTDAELEILSVLWERGPSTVRQTRMALADKRDSDKRDIGYTTVLKLI